MESKEPESLLAFWFGALSEGFADATHRKRWFSGGTEFDEQCRIQFSDLSAAIAAGNHEDWLANPRGRLAYILACDQLPRNIHRGSTDAFAADQQALSVARQGIEQGVDRLLEFDERAFFYMPFEHSESLIDQHACIGLFTQLRDQTPAGQRHLTGNYLQFAHQHRDLIQRFGRFPHRNQVLNRTSTRDELSHLLQGNDFGQSTRTA